MEPDQPTNGGHSMGAAAASLMAGSHYPFLGFLHLTLAPLNPPLRKRAKEQGVEYRSKMNETIRVLRFPKHIRSSCELEIGFFYRLISISWAVSVDRN